MEEDLDAIFGAGNYTVSAVSLLNGPSTIAVATGFNGSTNQELFANGSSILPGETATIELEVTVHEITDPQNNGLGFYENQVTLNATGPFNNIFTDVSVDGTDPDPGNDSNPNNDTSPTVGNLTPIGYVGAAKTATVAGDGTGVVFDFHLEHLGNTPVTVSLIEDLTTTFITGGTFSVVLSLIHI